MPAKKISIDYIPYDSNNTEAVLSLRKERFSQNQPFRFNDSDLPPKRFYLEFKNGAIQLVRLLADNKSHYVEKTLNPLEEWEVRRKHKINKL